MGFGKCPPGMVRSLTVTGLPTAASGSQRALRLSYRTLEESFGIPLTQPGLELPKARTHSPSPCPFPPAPTWHRADCQEHWLKAQVDQVSR
jgi:hypothetical protein